MPTTLWRQSWLDLCRLDRCRLFCCSNEAGQLLVSVRANPFFGFVSPVTPRPIGVGYSCMLSDSPVLSIYSVSMTAGSNETTTPIGIDPPRSIGLAKALTPRGLNPSVYATFSPLWSCALVSPSALKKLIAYETRIGKQGDSSTHGLNRDGVVRASHRQLKDDFCRCAPRSLPLAAHRVTPLTGFRIPQLNKGLGAGLCHHLLLPISSTS